MFNIIIPNYNNGPWLDRLFESLYKQTYDGFIIIFVDDMSTDDSLEIARRWEDKFRWGRSYLGVFSTCRKAYNGGTRNIAYHYMQQYKPKPYTLFIDSDDCLVDEECLEAISRTIEQNNYPDLVRLSYYFCCGQDERLVDLSDQDTVEKIVHDINVACWTKCIKTDKLVLFPENTLMEDVVQHIAQLDKINTVATCRKPIIKWNRNNSNSCSNNTELQNGKWRSSLYRYYADLLDLKVNKQECQAELIKRRAQALDNIRNDRYEQ